MMAQVSKTYTNGHPLAISDVELNQLATTIQVLAETTLEAPSAIVHDVMYSYFTDHSED
ncbi:hypothetical protein [Bacillus sp. LL01]|uniref:hypothetical protein n=1 Tax=Bacillus sp. LL01 TaxID=1665556 RepID=UPI0018E3952D